MLGLFLLALAVAQVNTQSFHFPISHSYLVIITPQQKAQKFFNSTKNTGNMLQCLFLIDVHHNWPKRTCHHHNCLFFVLGQLSHSWPPWLLGVWLSSFSCYSQFWSSGDQILSQASLVEVFCCFANFLTTFTTHVLEFCYWILLCFISGLRRVLFPLLLLILLMTVV